jgi:two-component sensor histidine kinase
MVVSASIRLAVYAYSGVVAFFVLVPGIVAAGLMFDRGSGFYATIIGGLMAAYLSPLGDDPRHWAPLTLFIALGFTTAFFSETLRKTIEALAAAERSKDLLLRELHHRTRNNMSIMAALLRAQLRSSDNADTRAALGAAVRRISVMASIEDFLRPSGADRVVGLGDYLQEFAGKMEELRADTVINVTLKSERLDVPEQIALPVGIIVNELVTNSIKHAFPEGRRGAIEIAAWRDGDLAIEVKDNGVGCPETAVPRVGTRLLERMAQQLNGTLVREPGHPGGCVTRVTIPIPSLEG